jgi:hypothetical protein
MREVRFAITPTNDGKIRGYAALFDTWSKTISERGRTFREKITRGALAPAENVSLWWMHDQTQPLANTKSGTLKITSDAKGVAFEADIGDTQRADEIRDLVRRNVVSEMSIGFSVEEDSWNGTSSRTVTRATLHECSLVETAAYSGTFAEIRKEKNMAWKEDRAALAALKADYTNAPDDQQEEIRSKIEEIEERMACERSAFEARLAAPAALKAPAARVVSPVKDSERDWFRGGFRSERSIGLSISGGSANLSTNAMIPSLSNEFVKYLDQEMVIRNLATVETRGVDTDVAIISNRPTASLVAEGAAYVAAEFTATKVSFKSYKTAHVSDVTEEALQDTVWDLASNVVSEHARAHARKWESLYATGTGSAQPTGMFAASWATTSTSTTTATLPTIDDMVTAAFKLNPAYFGTASWLMNQATWANLLKSTSNGKYLLNGENGNILKDGAVALLLGRPVYLSEFAPTASTTGTVSALFGDFKRAYRIVDRAQVSFTVDTMSQAASGLVRYSSRMRSDAQPVDLNAAVKITVK